MRIKVYLLVLFLGIFLVATNSRAQTVSSVDYTKLKSNMVSDDQLLAMYEKYEGQISESEAMSLLIKQGLDPNEAQLLEKRLKELLSSGGRKTKNSNTTGLPTPTYTDYSRDTTRISDKQPVRRVSAIYGLDLFTNPNLKFEPNIRIATPEGYILGPDDEINVIFTGLNEAVSTGKISPDGRMQIARVGLVYLNGLTIAQARDAIRKRAIGIYPALASGKTSLTVTLGSVRSIRVNIIGEVVAQGQFTVSSLSTLFNALYLANGPTRNGSLRNIEVIRGNTVIKVVDLYSFIQTGISRDNIRLQDQDVIRVPPYSKRVAIDGAVKRSGLFELKSDETITDLLKYTSGFSDDAFKKIAKVSQIGTTERNVKDVPEEMFDRYVLKNADSVYFGTILNRYSNRVNIEGAVYRPGQYELTTGITLKQLVSKAEGLRDDAALGTGYIKRTSPELEKEMISFNTGDVMKGIRPDILLMREDTVVIISTQELRDNRTITIGGNVRSGGTFVYRKGMTISDALVMANGFTPEAANHRIEVSRLVINKSDVLSNELVKIYTINLDSTMQGDQGKFMLEPLDFIYVPRLVNYKSLGNVKVRGEILNPGDYPLTRRDETAAEFIARAGGITPNGSIENAQVYRNGTRVGIDLFSNSQRKVKNTMTLMEGDSIYVPRQTSFVEVAGAVNTPQLLNYSSTNFTYYVNSAGGLTEKARIKNAFVQYPNGTNQPVKSFLFFRNYPKVIAGSKIVVPEQQGERKGLNVVEISAIASGLTALLTVIAIFIK